MIKVFSSIKKKIEERPIFNQIKDIIKEKPMKNAILVRFLFIPSGFKQYVLSAIDLSFFDFFFSDMIGSSFYAVEAAVMSSEFNKFSDFI